MDAPTDTVESTRDSLRPLRYLWRIPLLLLLIVLGIGLCLFILSVARGVMRNGREPFGHRTIRWWSKGLLRVFGFRVRRFGQPLDDPALFVCNHTSWLDIEVLHTQRAACFVAKSEIARWPLVGWMAAKGGTIFHQRGSNHSLATVMQEMTRRMRAGRSVAVFPEGGTGDGRSLRVFHARILQAALDAEAPVQPVALRFSRDGERCFDAGFRKGESFLANFLRLMGERPLTAEVHFLTPVPASLEGRKRMAEAARSAIAEVLDAGA
jgi:lyso-ornithine lipid O-acyltransferase